MARKKKKIQLTSGEMDLVNMLLGEGPVTLAQAHRAFRKYGRPIAYPTVQTRLNRLVKKGFAAKSNDRPTKYRSLVSQQEIAIGHLDHLLHKLIESSVAPLVCHLISERPLTAPEIDQLRKLLTKIEKGSKRQG